MVGRTFQGSAGFLDRDETNRAVETPRARPTMRGMWFPMEAAVDWSEAERRLGRVDPVMRGIIRRVGPCTLAPRRDYFVKLAQSIYSQQISTAVAAVLFGRLRDRFPNRRPTPAGVVKFLTESDEAAIKAVGLSRQKRVYL